MERQGEEVHVTTAEARGGSTPHIVRYVLMFSLVLAILALSAIWIIGAVTVDTQPDMTPHAAPAPAQS
jgi:hypothetical protein